MLESDKEVHVFRHQGLWLDIGRVEDFQRAQEIAWDEQSASIEAVAAA
jgi:mannose-1-phosphate guanylyltransferase